MNLKTFFKYTSNPNYDFTIGQTENEIEKNESSRNTLEKVYSSIDDNLQFVKYKYNYLINSDVMIREFSLVCQNKNYRSFILYIDGMSDSNLINHFVLSPLMFKGKNNTSALNLSQNSFAHYIYNCLIPDNNVTIKNSFSEIIDSINSGNCVLFVDTLDIAFDIDVKGFKQRNIEKPGIESVIKGPQEAFVENIRTNTSILRRITNNENLIIENIEIGTISKTRCALCYMKNIANNNLIAEARFRLNNLSIDSLLSSGELEQLIQDDNIPGVPQILSTERPDKCVKAMSQGRAVILVNGNPYALIIPSVLTDFLASPEDSNQNPMFANFLKFIRLCAFIITLLLPRDVYCYN